MQAIFRHHGRAIAISLLLVTLATGPFTTASADESSIARLTELVDRLDKHNDQAALEELKRADIKVVHLIEARLAQGYPPLDEARLAILCQNMESSSERVRKAAVDELPGMGPLAGPAIKRASKAQREAGHAAVADALAQMASAARYPPGRMNLAKVLGEQYKRHFDELFTQRWPAFVKDINDADAQRWLCHVPFDELWKKLAEQPAKDKLRLLLLLRRSAKWDEAMAKQLAAFSAKEVLEAAAATWWPIEIEPVQMDGAYGWTTRAGKVEGNLVTDILRLSVKMPDYGNVNERGQWVHIEYWDRWHYIFRFAQAQASKDALVVSERMIRRDTLPFHGGMAEEMNVRCNTVRGVPNSVKVPTMAMGMAESLDWHTGAVYECAKPYIPEKYHERLRFKPDKHPVPEITLPDEVNVLDPQ